jgi:amino acid transporter
VSAKRYANSPFESSQEGIAMLLSGLTLFLDVLAVAAVVDLIFRFSRYTKTPKESRKEIRLRDFVYFATLLIAVFVFLPVTSPPFDAMYFAILPVRAIFGGWIIVLLTATYFYMRHMTTKRHKGSL